MSAAGMVAGADVISIGELTEADLDGVMEIERQSYPTPWSRQAFLAELTDNSFAVYIAARQDGRVIGYAGMWLLFDEAHVTNIAVHPDFRGRRVGHRLLSELERRAVERGVRKMTLEVRPSNPAAQRLYRQHGFVARGRRRAYYCDNREDAIIMWKDNL